MRAALAAAALALLALPAAAETIHVHPGEGTPFQDALDAAVNGDLILVHRGTYLESLGLFDRSDLTIQAVGKVVVDAGGAGYAFSMDSVSGLLVEGIQFRNAANDGVSPDDCAELEFRRCSFRDIADSGIQDFGTAGFLRIVNCSFLRCGWGLAISYSDGAGSEGIEVRDCTFKKIGSNGIEFSGNGALIVGNRISMEEPGTGIGIEIRDNGAFTDAEISGNTITKASVGILITGSGHTIQSSVVKGCTTGILVDGTGANDLLSNTVKKSVERGIEINNPGNDVIGNVIKGSGEYDIGGSATQGSNNLEGNTYDTSGFASDA